MRRSVHRSMASSSEGPRSKAWTCCLSLIALALAGAVNEPVMDQVVEAEGSRSRAWQRIELASQRVGDGSPLGTRRPNVLIFLTDDQRFGTTRAMKATRRLIGRKGLTFTNAHATTPLCCPSRASVMTGRYAHNHRVRRNFSGGNLKMSTTLQHDLSNAGYLTAIIGKFLNGWNPKRIPPDFDRSVLLTPVNSPFAYGTNAYTDSFFSIDGRVRRVKRYATDFIRSRTVKFLRRFNRRDRRPWMMYVQPFAPHSPALPARRHAGTRVGGVRSNPAIRDRNRYGKAPDVRRWRVDQEWVKDFAPDQNRTMLAVDEMIARIFRWLSKLEEARRTLVIFTSDNGVMWGEHGLAGKKYPYTYSTKVPMLMRWPGHVRPRSSTARLVANVDIAPTVYHATGVEPSHVLDGRSLLSRSRRKVLLLEHWENTEWRALRSRRHLYIEYTNGPRIRFRELYNLKRDPWQLRNLLHRNPDRHRDIATRLHRRLVRRAHCKGTACF